jgi:7,8-dihydropterin-6-yl-methyl-4-(beta-D-ribofuranosyl)aminobenzene 5'-phosphate synthase
MFFVSGEIPRVTGFERGYPGQVRLADDDAFARELSGHSGPRRHGRPASVGRHEAIIPQTVKGLRAFDLKTLAAGHCIGLAGNDGALAVGDRVLAPTAVGKRFTF